ncbi:MAG: hypothetical protein ABR559_05300 [Gemmatimonadota bacterium]
MSARGVPAALVALSAGFAALSASACAGGPSPDTQAGIAPAISAAELSAADVGVLPVASVVLPAATPAAVPRDSLAQALQRFADGALATALTGTGAVGRALSADEMAAALATVGPDVLGIAYRAVGSAPAGPGLLDAEGGAAFAALTDLAGPRYFLVPRALTLTGTGVLRFRGVFAVALVDAPAGRLLWSGDVAAENALPPSSQSEDLYGAALELATAAAAQAVAGALSR